MISECHTHQSAKAELARLRAYGRKIVGVELYRRAADGALLRLQLPHRMLWDDLPPSTKIEAWGTKNRDWELYRDVLIKGSELGMGMDIHHLDAAILGIEYK